MGRDLIIQNSAVLEDIQLMDKTLQNLGDGPSWLIEGIALRNLTDIQLTLT